MRKWRTMNPKLEQYAREIIDDLTAKLEEGDEEQLETAIRSIGWDQEELPPWVEEEPYTPPKPGTLEYALAQFYLDYVKAQLSCPNPLLGVAEEGE